MEYQKTSHTALLRTIIPLFILISLCFSYTSKLNSLENTDIRQEEYIVKSGDTLWSISRKSMISIETLLQLNSFKTYKNGFPIILIDQKIILSENSFENSKDFENLCQNPILNSGYLIDPTLKLEPELCLVLLREQLDPKITGIIDSLKNTNNIFLDEEFWTVYSSDKRYSFYFFNSYGNDNYLNKSKYRIFMIQAALRGDYYLAETIFWNKNEYYELVKEDYASTKIFVSSILSSFSPSYAFLVLEGYRSITFYPEDYQNILGPNYNFDINEIPNEKKIPYLLDDLSKDFDTGEMSYYAKKEFFFNELLKIDSNIINWDEMSGLVNLMYYSLNNADIKFAMKASNQLYKRFGLDPKGNMVSAIYNDLIKTGVLPKDLERGTWTWLLNLMSIEDHLFPSETYYSDRKEFLASIVIPAVLEDDGSWYSDVGLGLYRRTMCDEAEEFFIKAFNIYDRDINYDLKKNYSKKNSLEKSNLRFLKQKDPISEPLALARCYLIKDNKQKAQVYLDYASKNLDYLLYDQTFYRSHIGLNKIKVELAQAENNKVFNSFKTLSEEFFKNELKVGFTIDPVDIRNLINDYSDVYEFFKNLGFDMLGLKNTIELEAFKSRTLANRKLEQLKLSSNQTALKDLKTDLVANKSSINHYESLLETDFNESHYIELDKLFSARKKLISKVLSSNKEMDALLNPTYKTFSKVVETIKDDSVVVTFNLGANSSKVTVLSENKIHVMNLNTRIDIVDYKISEVRKTLKNIDVPFAFKEANDLYEILVKPIEKFLANKNNIYIYGSDLIDLPFGIMLSNYSEIADLKTNYEKSLRAKWLIEDYSFARVFPVNNIPINTEYDNNFIGFANPSSIVDLGLEPLPDSENEIRDLALSSKEFSNEFLLVQNNASKSNLKKLLGGSFERVVFATHSLPAYWKGISNESSLVLADKSGDYLLSSAEIIDLNINSDIVVLSSCNTEEKGSDSLYKAFLVAGSNSVMYSNWELETLSAGIITDQVFKSILFESLPKHQALQKASINIMNDYSNPIYAHPAFWGNFSIAYRSL
jgi:CHAT domain-containing protein